MFFNVIFGQKIEKTAKKFQKTELKENWIFVNFWPFLAWFWLKNSKKTDFSWKKRKKIEKNSKIEKSKVITRQKTEIFQKKLILTKFQLF